MPVHGWPQSRQITCAFCFQNDPKTCQQSKNQVYPNTPFMKLLRKLHERTLCNPKNTLIIQNYFGIILFNFRILISSELSKTYYCVRPSNFSETYTVSLPSLLKITGSSKYNFLDTPTYLKNLPQTISTF